MINEIENEEQRQLALAKIEEANKTFGYVMAGYYDLPNPMKAVTEHEVKQPNDLTRAIYRCTGMAQKIFVLMAAEFMRQGKTRKDRWVKMDLSDVLRELKSHRGTIATELTKQAIKEVADLSVTLADDDKSFHYLHLFEEAKLDKETNIVKFKPTEKFATYLEVEHKRGFTIFSIDAISRLSSFYAMRYFEIAMSYYGFKGHLRQLTPFAQSLNLPIRNTWFFNYTVEQLRLLFDLKKSEYSRMSNLLAKVVRQPIEELNKKQDKFWFNVEIVRKRNTQKGKITDFIFWVTEKEERGQVPLYEDAYQRQMRGIAEAEAERQELADFKVRYPLEFAEELSRVKSERSAVPGLPTFEVLDEAEALRRLKARGLGL